jgi:multidrug efflux pump subunit AcrB
MWIVRLALRRPNTLVVLALLITVLGIASIAAMSIDIFPAINIPAHHALGGGWDPGEHRAPR